MAKRRWAWVKDVLVFAGMALLNFVLVFPCGIVVILSDSPKKGFGVSDLWFWVFATPSKIVTEFGFKELAGPFHWVNPLIYGLMWWGAWRVWKLFRTKTSA